MSYDAYLQSQLAQQEITYERAKAQRIEAGEICPKCETELDDRPCGNCDAAARLRSLLTDAYSFWGVDAKFLSRPESYKALRDARRRYR